MTRTRVQSSRSGQVFPIVVWMVAIITVLTVVVFDIFLSTRAKMHLANTGDAAALAAARWQGITLNMIGDLNLAHIAAACDPSLAPEDFTNVVHGVNAIAERLAFAGPMMGLYAANEAVRLNHEANNSNRADKTVPTYYALAEILRRETVFARSDVSPTRTWPEKAADYAGMIQTVLDAGVFMGVDNARLLSSGATGNHIYYARGFYDAAAPNGPKQWLCRYNRNRHRLSEDAMRNASADDLEASGNGSYQNSGFFGVDVQCAHVALADVAPNADFVLEQLWHDFGSSAMPVNAQTLRDSGMLYDSHFGWFFLSPSPYGIWRKWHEIDRDEEGTTPLVGVAKAEYDVYGAMAATRVRRTIATVAGAFTNAVDWMAAAKPFGCFPDGRRAVDMFGAWSPGETGRLTPLVAPVYSFVRLIPLGGVGEANLYKSDPEWLAHLEHLRANNRSPGCWRCRRIDEWENGGREESAKWFSTHSHDEYCDPPGKGPGYDGDPFNG